MANRVSTKQAVAALRGKQNSVAYDNGSDARAAAADLFDDEVAQKAIDSFVTQDDNEIVIGGGLRLSAVGLQIQSEMDEAQWYSLFDGIAKVKRAFQWMRGDWLVYGVERKYGETEAQYNRISLMTGLSIGTLQNIYAICSKIEIPRRRGNLTFAHHGEVASLSPDEQIEWLDKAESNKWNAKELRAMIQNKPLPVISPALLPNKAYIKRVNRIAGKLRTGKKLTSDEIQWFRTLLDSQEA